MKQSDDLDQMLSAWLDDPYTAPTPRILGKVLERTSRTRQRPAWANLERWLPMAVIARPAAAAPSLRIAWLLLIALLVLALAASVAFVGSQLLRGTMAIPQGGAAVLAFDSGVNVPGGRQEGDIYTVRADGTDLRQLTSGPGIESGPVWSPDGIRIAYRLWQDGSDSIAVMDAGGGNRTTLATTGQRNGCVPVWVSGLAWSPDGSSLVFPTSAACDGRYDLFIVATDGSSPAARLLAPGLNSTSAAWSPDGTQIAFQGREASGSRGLYVADVGASGALAGGLKAQQIGTEAGTYTVPALHGSPEYVMGPRWSPDGTELVAAAGTGDFCGSAAPGTWDAFVVRPDGSGLRPLAPGPANEINPTWSPDGKRLAFHRTVDPSEFVNERPCTVATWVVDADGTNLRRLDELGDTAAPPPLWSPDGTRLLGILIDLPPGNRQVYPEVFSLYLVTVDGSSPLVTIDDVYGATWQPVAAPLPPAPTFAAVSPAP